MKILVRFEEFTAEIVFLDEILVAYKICLLLDLGCNPVQRVNAQA